MKRFIHVHSGEVMAGQGETILKSDSMRECLVIIAHDQVKKIGAIAHAMFSRNGNGDKRKHLVGFAPQDAIKEMLEDMRMLGSNEENIYVRVVAGENVPHDQSDPNYHRNIEDALQILRHRNIRINDDIVEEIGNTHVSLDVGTGNVVCG